MPSTRPSPIATLFPGYFALVMATGIVAIAAAQQNIDLLAEVLYAITAIAYVVLAVLLATRMVRFWSNFAARPAGVLRLIGVDNNGNRIDSRIE